MLAALRHKSVVNPSKAGVAFPCAQALVRYVASGQGVAPRVVMEVLGHSDDVGGAARSESCGCQIGGQESDRTKAQVKEVNVY